MQELKGLGVVLIDKQWFGAVSRAVDEAPGVVAAGRPD
jgi:hypothetical protein